jgi:hypothetical protein
VGVNASNETAFALLSFRQPTVCTLHKSLCIPYREMEMSRCRCHAGASSKGGGCEEKMV